MKLTAIDLDYIDDRLEACEFKYQEIYDEIRDHVIMAIEVSRKSGDERVIESVFDDMMSTQFPGYYAFEKIAIAYEKAYRIKIKKTIWANFRYYLNLQNILLLAVLFIIMFYLPQNKLTNIALFVCGIALAVVPVIYAHFQTQQVKTDAGKKSIVKEHIKTRAAFLLLINLYVLSPIIMNEHTSLSYKFYRFYSYYDSVIGMLLILFYIIYTLSIVRLCRQEFKIAR
jgi:hypothetical protein